MTNENTPVINPGRVRERIDSYILNKGYRIERMITCERFGIPSVQDLELGVQGVWLLVYGLNANQALRKLFAPIGKTYQRGRELFTRASVLTPRYSEDFGECEEAIRKYNSTRESWDRELSDELSNAGIIKRLLLRRKAKNVESDLKFLEKAVHHTQKSLPPQVSREDSISSLNELYFWLQLGEEDEESRMASDELLHPFDLLAEEQVRLLKIKRDLYKIKNHTAIVCLDQLQRDGLDLDERVSSEMERVPQTYLQDVPSFGRLRSGCPVFFGEGLRC